MRAGMLNGAAQVNLVKTKIAFAEFKEVESYEQLSEVAKLSTRGLKKKLMYQRR